MSNTFSDSNQTSKAGGRGVGTRIFVALGAMITITLVSAGVGLVGFEEISDKFTYLREDKLSDVKTATEELDLVSELDMSVAKLLAAGSIEEIDAAAARFAKATSDLGVMVGKSEVAATLTATIETALAAEMRLTSARTDEAVAAEEARAAIAEITRLAALAEEQLHPIVEQATEEFVGGLKGASILEGSLQRLLDGPYVKMRNRLDIDRLIHAIIAGAFEVANADSPEHIAEVNAVLQASRTEFANATAAAGDIGPLGETASGLVTLTDPETGIGSMRLREIIARGEVADSAPTVLDAMTKIAVLARGEITAAIGSIEAAGDAVDETIVTAETALGALATLSLLVGALAVFIVQGKVVRPLRSLAERTRGLAEGDLSPVTGFEGRRDEIGAMGSALAIFQEKLVNLRESEREREARAEKDKAARQAQDAVVSGLRAGLARLADGDLTMPINTPFTEEYEGLRADYNRAQSGLAGLIGEVVVKSRGINGGAAEVNQAADALARRTESQAAALEETVAALKQLTEGLNNAAEDAGKADSFTTSASQDAQSSEEVVRRSLHAMKRIETSSNQINQIISVIDDIAFQTNLLALNAGVEAARAGEAGRGFAVVASEVRALAQRCTDAAKEIKELISQSSTHVSDGVELVTKTGDALEGIVSKVAEINTIISSISASSREQAGAVGEIMAAMDQLDEVTQRNAAMVEEMTAASHELTGDSTQLSELVSRFRAPGAEMTARKPVAAPSPAAPKQKTPAAKAPAPKPSVPAKAASQGALRVVAQQDKVAPRPAGSAPRSAPALKPVVQADDANWEEF